MLRQSQPEIDTTDRKQQFFFIIILFHFFFFFWSLPWVIPVYNNNTQQYITAMNCPDTIELPMSRITTDQPLHYNVTCFKVSCSRHGSVACVLPHVTPSHPEWHPPPSLSHTVTQNAIHHHLVEVQRLPVPLPEHVVSVTGGHAVAQGRCDGPGCDVVTGLGSPQL